MKSMIFSLGVLAISLPAQAQDLIVKNDSSRVQAVVQEITPNQVKFRRFDYPGGPLIIEDKSQLAYIVFPNGIVEHFPKPVSPSSVYDPNRYNLDRILVNPKGAEVRQKKYDALYQFRNYVGFNYIASLNAALGFHYMRDFRKAHFVLGVPVAIGLGRPSITNNLYGGFYLDGMRTTRYQQMNYQAGISALFMPSVKLPVNFLLGPSLSFTEYRMQVQSHWSNKGQVANFDNNFKLYRSWYGVSAGLLARYSPRFSMCVLLSLGYGIDRYSVDDPYGSRVYEEIYKMPMNLDNTKAYLNFSWTLGYRF